MSYGVPACPDASVVKQPDGQEITVLLRGDEHTHWNEDAQGYAVVREPGKGQWVYASEVDGRLVPTVHPVGGTDPAAVGLAKPDLSRIAAEGKARRASKVVLKEPVAMGAGSKVFKNLVVLVNFTDRTITNSVAEFDALFNQIGYNVDGAVGSVKDYYLEATYGYAVVESTVVEPVTLDHGYAYYGANDETGDDVRPGEMVKEALAKLETRGFDFSTMDADHNGWIDGLTIIHAGGGEEYSGNDTNYIWSHMSVFGWVTYDGVNLALYHTEPARRGWDSSPSTWGITRIGVICHEMGHFFGLPDLYDYGGDSRGAGNFCLMAGASWNGNAGTTPAHMSVWCKSYLLLLSPTLINAAGHFTLDRIETSPSAYKIQGSWPSNEYFLIENRQGVGFDSAMPGSTRGMLIWHIDENQGNNDDQTHYKVDLEEASGPQHLQLNQNAGQDSDYYRSGNVTAFNDVTTPSNLSYSGVPLGFNVSDVSASGASMSFDVSLPVRLTLDIVNDPWGNVVLNPAPRDANLMEYPKGASVTLTAVAEPNRLFGHWEVYDSNHPDDANYAAIETLNPLAIVMNGDRHVAASFSCGGTGGGALMSLVVLLGIAVMVARRN